MGSDQLRIDKWLWHARFFKTRTLAQTFIQAGKVRLNTERVEKAHTKVKPGDVLTFQRGPHVRLIKVGAIGARRGPASEAQTLYEDLAPPPVRASEPDPDTAGPAAQRDRGAGRPTKKQRRETDRLRGN